jgi:hypothetical protein
MQAIVDALDTATADAFFFAIFFVAQFAFLGALLFAGLGIRGAWRWLARHSWRDAIVSVEWKALRQR